MFHWICALCILLTNVSFADVKKPEELILSTPEQLAHQDHLVGKFIGPLGGQLVLKQTDLEVKGAQPLLLDRYYVAPAIQPSYHPKGGQADLDYLYQHMLDAYRGWVFFPQSKLQILGPLSARVTDANGTTLDYCQPERHLYCADRSGHLGCLQQSYRCHAAWTPKFRWTWPLRSAQYKCRSGWQ